MVKPLLLSMLLVVMPASGMPSFSYDVPIQKRVETIQTAKCVHKITKYAAKVQVYPESNYYKFLLKKWKKRCQSS